jgi:hypothetical protein
MIPHNVKPEEKISVLLDSPQKHFRHPISGVLQVNYGITTIGEMLYLKDEELLRIRNFGKLALYKVIAFREAIYKY